MLENDENKNLTENDGTAAGQPAAPEYTDTTEQTQDTEAQKEDASEQKRSNDHMSSVYSFSHVKQDSEYSSGSEGTSGNSGWQSQRQQSTQNDPQQETRNDYQNGPQQGPQNGYQNGPQQGYQNGPQQGNPYSYQRNPEQPKRNRPSRKERQHKKHMNAYVKTIICAILFGVIAGGLVLGSYGIARNMGSTAAQTAASTEIATNEEKLEDAGSTADTSTSSDSTVYSVSDIAKNCASSVVAISTLSVSDVQTMFGTYQQESQGSGSGVIIAKTDSELLIATNNHVVENSEELTVCLLDSQDNVYTGQVKGTDSTNDLAVVAVPLEDIDSDVLSQISIATMGDSDQLQVGDEVVAIGNALGLGQSVTSGVVSALNRQVTVEDNTATLLQTDAAINPGNSGGALFNMKGELIGINSAKYASSEIEGMGFAIPISTAKSILDDLMTKETKTKLESGYGCLNITGGDVSDEAVEMYNIPEGVYVQSVTEGKAADKAGIQEGDIITALDGTTITGMDELKAQLQYYAAGTTVDITIYRNTEGSGYQAQTLSITLDNADDMQQSTSNSTTQSQSGSSSQDGSDSQDQNGLQDFSQFFGGNDDQ